MGAEEYLPDDRRLEALRAASATCQGCDLHARATQTVFGEGDAGDAVMLVGEQPGDKEDTSGHPFVGPAGHLLDRALEQAGIDRGTAYVTNAVKHFKWEPQGKRRLHKKPSAREVAACKPWLLAEIEAVGPDVVVCLGATAAQALFGGSFRLTKHRGELFDGPAGTKVLATVHPAAVLRAPDEASRRRQEDAFIDDLEVVARFLSSQEPR